MSLAPGTLDPGRRRTVYLVLLVICAVLSLRPVPAVNGAIELLFLPTRLVAELVAPLTWLRAGEVRAAEQHLDEEARRMRAEAAQLLAEEQAAALPTLPELLVGRRRIHGEVIRRSRGNLDRVEVRVASAAGIFPGLPVVTGDHFVGRVMRVDDADPPMVHVDLVTAQGFFVGAAVSARDWSGRETGARVALVVGGLSDLLATEPDQLHLALHNPVLRGLDQGTVVVAEPEAFVGELASLSAGFELGELQEVPHPEGGTIFRVESPLDFKSGLFQVIVLAPEADPGPGGGLEDAQRLELDTFVGPAWISARALTRGDVTPAREGRRLSAGRLNGVRAGRAVALGAHLVGRVGEVGPLTSDLSGLGDPGLRLAVLGEIEGEDRPRPLGELVSLGRERGSGLLRFRWTCRIDLGQGRADERLRARLYTGSGEDGVPRGLFVGHTELPTTRATHRLLVEQDPAVRDLSRVFVWRGAVPGRGQGESP